MNNEDQLRFRSCQIAIDECLAVLSKHYNIPVEKLEKMNTFQLQNAFNGWEAEPLDIEVGNRIAIVEPPEDGPCGKGISTCESAYIEFEDILYVPKHPQDDKSYWYALTADALEKLKQEREQLSFTGIDPASKDYNKDILQKLNDLGVLSRYDYAPFETFLKDKTKKDLYRAFTVLKYQHFAGELMSMSEERLQVSASSVGFPYQERIEKVTAKNIRNIKMMYSLYSGYSADYLVDFTEQDKQEARYQATKKVKQEFWDFIQEEIESLEDEAKKRAEENTTDDGTKFIFDKDLKYFTSDREKVISGAVSWMKTSLSEHYMDDISCTDYSQAEGRFKHLWDVQLKKGKDFNDERRNLPIEEYVNRLREDPSLNNAFLFNMFFNQLSNFAFVLKEQCLSLDELNNSNLLDEMANHQSKYNRELSKSAVFSTNWRETPKLLELWKDDFLEEPQIALLYDMLQRDRLVKGNTTDSSQNEIIDEKKKDDDKWLTDLMNNGFIQWSYYDAVALARKVDSTLEHQVNDLRSIGLELIPKFFDRLFLIKKACLVRQGYWKDVATNRANLGKVNYISEDVKHKSFTLLWDLNDWQPREKRPGVIMNMPKNNDIRVTECYLLSEAEGGSPFYLRCPSWLLPTDKDKGRIAEGKAHVKNIAIKGAQPGGFQVVNSDDPDGKSNTKPDANSNGASKLLESSNIAPKEVFKKVLKSVAENQKMQWEDFSKIHSQTEGSLLGLDWHYQTKQDHRGYQVSADVQLFRYTSSVVTNVTTPGSAVVGSAAPVAVDTTPENPNGKSRKQKYVKHEYVKHLAGDVALKVSLDAIRGGVSFSAWFPINEQPTAESRVPYNPAPATGYRLKIPYLVDKQEDPVYYDAGEFCAWLSISVYGLAAVSFNMSGTLGLGQSETDGQLGVRGMLPKVSDYNHSASAVKESNRITLQGAAQVGVNVGAFAGAEAGGVANSKVLWRPPMYSNIPGKPFEGPNTNELKELGSITLGGAIGAGIGADFTFRLGYDSGRFFLIVAARLVLGPGVAGTVSIAINPFNADLFVGCLLNILSQSGFKRLAIFDDEDSKTFYYLNQRLTLSFVLGLSLAEVMLMPSIVFERWRQKSLKVEYAPWIAKQMSKNRQSLAVKTWVRNIPPETLAKLLDTLTKSSDDNGTERQLEVIVYIMSLLQPLPGERLIIRQRQFTKALELMGLPEGQHEASYLQRWNRISGNWERLSSFVNGFKTDEGIDIGVTRDTQRYISNFQTFSSILCGHLYRYTVQWKEDVLVEGRGFAKDFKQGISGCYLKPDGLRAMVAVDIVVEGSEQHQLLKEAIELAQTIEGKAMQHPGAVRTIKAWHREN